MTKPEEEERPRAERTREQSLDVAKTFAQMVLRYAQQQCFDCAVSMRLEHTARGDGDDGAQLYTFSTTSVENTEALLGAALVQVIATDPKPLPAEVLQ